MIPSLSEIAYGVYGAWRLAHWDRSAVALFDATVAGFWKSFFAAILVVPAFFVSWLILMSHVEVAAGPLRIFLLLLLSYVISWLLFPVIVYSLCGAMSRQDFFLRYIVAHNWAQVIAALVLLPVLGVVEMGILPTALGHLLGLAVDCLVLAYLWFIASTMLSVAGWTAAAFVVLEVVLDQVLRAIALGMMT